MGENANNAKLESARAAVEEADQAVADAAAAREKAVDDFDTLRVESMDVAVVEEAKALNINPRNFEDTRHLKEAIKKVKSEQSEEE